MKRIAEQSLHVPSQKNDKLFYLKSFWLGFLLFLLGSVIVPTGIVAVKYCQLIQGIGVIILLATAVKLVHLKLSSGYLGFFFLMYILWSLFTILRAWENFSNYDFIKEFIFGGPDHGLVYFLPLVLLFDKKMEDLKVLFDVLLVFGVVYLVLSAIFIKQLLAPGGGDDRTGLNIVESLSVLSTPIGFMILTAGYRTKKKTSLRPQFY